MVQIYGFIWNYQGIKQIIFPVHSNTYKFHPRADGCKRNFISFHVFLYSSHKITIFAASNHHL